MAKFSKGSGSKNSAGGGRQFDQIVQRLASAGPAKGGSRAPMAMPKQTFTPKMDPGSSEMPGAVQGMGAETGPHVTHIHIHIPSVPSGRKR
jgi:hypothetical protein